MSTTETRVSKEPVASAWPSGRTAMPLMAPAMECVGFSVLEGSQLQQILYVASAWPSGRIAMPLMAPALHIRRAQAF